MIIASVVEHDDHATPGRLLARQSPEEGLKRHSVENRTHHSYELACVQTDCPKVGHRLPGRHIPQDRVLDFRRYPHAAAGTVLLKVTFNQAPQFDVGMASRTAESFLLPRLLADSIEPLGAGAYVAGSPTPELVVGIAEHRRPLQMAAGRVPTTPARPTAWQANRRPAASCASLFATCANPLYPPCAVCSTARSRAARPARSDLPSVAPSCRSRQTVRRPLSTIVPPAPAAFRAVGGRSETPCYVQSPAGSLFASPQHPRSAAYASSFSQRKERSDNITMLHYLCRRA